MMEPRMHWHCLETKVMGEVQLVRESGARSKKLHIRGPQKEGYRGMNTTPIPTEPFNEAADVSWTHSYPLATLYTGTLH
jgi:hypothetical protein